MKYINFLNFSEKPQNNLPLGIILLTLEIIIAMVIATLVKLTTSTSSIYLILLSRFLFSLPLLFVFGYLQRGKKILQINQVKTLIARIITGLLSLFFWFLALKNLNLSTASVLFQLLSIFITLLAPIIVGELFGLRRFFAILIGFMGVIIINSNLENLTMFELKGTLFGLCAPFFGALMFLYLRKLGNKDAAVSSAIWHNSIGTLVFLLICFYIKPNLNFDYKIWIFLISIGFLSSFQQFLMAASHQVASASALAPIHYLTVPLGFVFGIVFLKEVITFNLILGSIIIICSAFYIFHRENKLNM